MLQRVSLPSLEKKKKMSHWKNIPTSLIIQSTCVHNVYDTFHFYYFIFPSNDKKIIIKWGAVVLSTNFFHLQNK